jgi:hypothetical protein
MFPSVFPSSSRRNFFSRSLMKLGKRRRLLQQAHKSVCAVPLHPSSLRCCSRFGKLQSVVSKTKTIGVKRVKAERQARDV